MPFDNPHQRPFGDIELLLDARRIISDRGDWVQGQFQDRNRRCLVAALSSVSGGSRGVYRANGVERRLTRLLTKQLPPRAFWSRTTFLTARQRLIWFNDDPRTSHEDVIALFDRVINDLTREVRVCVSG